jgi:hypothetical protein
MDRISIMLISSFTKNDSDGCYCYKTRRGVI